LPEGAGTPKTEEPFVTSEQTQERMCPHIDFTSDETRDDLYGVLDRLQQECPVVRTDAHGGYWVVTRYTDVSSVLCDYDNFTSTDGVTVPRVEVPLRALPMESDPPIQHEYRKLINPFLSPVKSAALEPEVRQIVREFSDRFLDQGSCDAVSALAQHVSSTVLFRLLFRADETDMESLHRWVAAFAYEPTSPKAMEGALGLISWCYALIGERRENPRGGIVQAVIEGIVDGRPITDEEALGILSLLIFGGFDTTANAIASSLVHLARNPMLQTQLREHPERLKLAVEEFLRFDPPVIGLSRRAINDVEVGGQLIPAGDAVYFSLAGANHDPSQFDGPHDLRADRWPNKHLTFSAGVHRCVGSHLARVMLQVTLEEILATMHDIRLVGDVEYYQATARGPKALHITFTPHPRAN
jgi:cytochrome P450